MYPKGIFVLLLIVMLLVACASLAVAETQAPDTPLTPHCVGSGPLPLDPDFCGCTWGAVYYRGQAVAQAPVVLQFGNQVTNTVTTQQDEAPHLYYTLTGATLGAKKGDVMTVTAEFAGQRATRTFRAWPNADKEQEVALVLPMRGVWVPWLTGGYTRTLAVAGSTLWAGGSAGLLAVDLATNVSTTHTLPWSDSAVVGMAVAPNGHIWAVGPHSLAEFDGSAWQNRATPFLATIRTLVVHPTTGALWLGGGDTDGALAVYNGDWQPVTTVAEVVTALAVDGAGDIWVGTWGSGVYRQNHNVADVTKGWQQYKVKDGLASAYILVIATDSNSVWFGTNPYRDNQGIRGGVSRYHLTNNTWHSYTAIHGLPTDPEGAAASIYALAFDADGVPWVGTSQGIHLLATPTTWITDTLTSDAVRALVVTSDQIIATHAGGQLLRLDRNLIPGAPPTVQITTADWLTVTPSTTFTLTAGATDNDQDVNEIDLQILAWDWRADNQPLCTTAVACTVPANTLTLGQHTVTLRVQDDEGDWSAPVTTTVVITETIVPQPPVVYLPAVMR